MSWIGAWVTDCKDKQQVAYFMQSRCHVTNKPLSEGPGDCQCPPHAAERIIETDRQLRLKKEESESLKLVVEDRNKKLESAVSSLSSMTTERDGLLGEVSRLQSLRNTLNETVMELEKDLSVSKQRVSDLSNTILHDSEKDQEINRLNEKLDRIKALI